MRDVDGIYVVQDKGKCWAVVTTVMTSELYKLPGISD